MKKLLLGGFFILCLLSLSQVWGDNTNWLNSTLNESWGYYKSHFMVNGERVQSNNYGGTITEGQSYALLKALWMNDSQTFAKTWAWTQKNMHRPHDHLLGWRWGAKNFHTGLIEIEDATDADQDIAYALMKAGAKWKNSSYTAAGLAMAKDLWQYDVVSNHGMVYLSPGTWSGFRQGEITLNPSYMAPYVYRYFATQDHDPRHKWSQLAQNTYTTLEKCSDLTANGLPPNWCGVNLQTGRIQFSDKQGQGSRYFGYDAFRVFWRMALDADIGSSEARQYLKKHTALQRFWQSHHYLPAGFSETGQPLGKENSGFALAAAIAQGHIIDPSHDAQRYNAMLRPAYYSPGFWFNSHDDFLHSVIWLHLETLTR